MQEIRTKKGESIKVDDSDFAWLNQFKWHISSRGYAVHSNSHRGIKVLMHRLIMNTPEGMDTDHLNRDKLDNRRKNLRVCTHADNMLNKGAYPGGISWHKPSQKWYVRVQKNMKRKSYGLYKNKNEALAVLENARLGV